MAHVSEKKFPLDPKDYRLYEEIGEGVSAMVYRALCVPYNEIVAIKVIDLEKCDNDLDGIRREVHTLSLIYHPNVLHAHCSFILDTYLWVVMPYLSGGSCLHIMRFAYPDGFEELVIATLLREVLKALVYLHNQGRIHRDVKAGNILIGANGIVKLADFGVSASLFDAGDRRRARISFVGTPCWMAPEVMEQIHGYDIKADIWSFGITALELAHGHAPLSKYPPMKVLLLTLQSAPPGLDYERDRRFSKSFKEMIASCLVKDPAKRPSAERLLKHSFFKSARSNEYLARAILDGLAPLGERFRELKAKDAELLLQDMAVDGDKKHLSQQEYLRGISGWNFDLDELKAQAALIDASDTSSMTEELSKDMHGSGTIEASDIVHSENVSGSKSALLREGEPFGSRDLEDSLSFSFPMLPLRALKECFDVSEDVISPSTPDLKDATRPYVSQAENLESETHEGVAQERSSSVLPNIPGSDLPKDFSPLFLPAHGIDLSKDATNDVERRGDDQEHGLQYGRNFSIPMVNRQRRDLRPQLINTLEEKLEERIVQQKGRFRVTAADASPKGDRSGKAQSIGFIGSGASSSTSAAFVVSSLRHILQQTGMQREQLAKLIKHIEQSPGQIINVGESSKRDVAQIPLSSMRERELQSYAGHLQRCNADLAEELQRLKTQNAQLERQLGALASKKVGQRK